MDEELCIGIEYDGSYFHAKKNNTDAQKLDKCKQAGIRILRIREVGLLLRNADDFQIENSREGKYFSEEIANIFRNLFAELRKLESLQDIPDPDLARDKLAICHYIRKRRSSSYVGQKLVMKNGMEAEIIEASSGKDCTVRFSDGEIVYGKAYNAFQRGAIKHPIYNRAKFLSDNRLRKLEGEWLNKTINVAKYPTEARVIAINKTRKLIGKREKWCFDSLLRYENGIEETISERRFFRNKFIPIFAK